MKKTILILAFATMGVHAQEHQKTEPTISVTGEGIVKMVPDQVLIRIRVENEGKSAKEVKQKNDEAINEVFQFVKSMKIDKKDVTTEYINLSKNYDYNTKKYNFVANQSVSILLKDLSKYEALTQGLLDAGANRFDGVEFKSSQLEKYKSEARMVAAKNAKQRADEYASALGQTVGKAIQVSESGSYVPPMPTMRVKAMMDSSESINQTIAVGEMEISVSVNVVFQLQ